MDYEERKAPFRPLIPDVRFIRFNAEANLEKISSRTAAVVLETIQGGAGFIEPIGDYLQQVRQRCTEVGALLILDEIQPGFGRTGKMFAFEHYGCAPDILVIGKAMASGLPAGAFTASRDLMGLLSQGPELGHITTFGGNPVIAAAALATLREISGSALMEQALVKEQRFREKLTHPLIKEIRGRGLMLALIFETPEQANEVILRAAAKGLVLFWLLFEPKAVRLTPPLTISIDEIDEGCRILNEVLKTFK
jgi:acetylornithine/succinyldiaminopimelate/putrescine aminotransferase